MMSSPKWLRPATVFIALVLAVQPALAQISIGPLGLGLTKNQRLVGVNKYGNISKKLGTRRGHGRVIIFSTQQSMTALLWAGGQVTNKSRRSQIYANTGTTISLPGGGKVDSQNDLVTVFGWRFSNYGRNSTFASYFGN